MDRAEFESDLQREGKIEPNVHLGSRAHEFDDRLIVLEGSITLVVSADRCAYRPGETCHVPAGTKLMACDIWLGAAWQQK